MGNLQLPPQIHHQNVLIMLIQGISGVQRNGGGMTAEWEFLRRHASYFNTGFVTYGEREVALAMKLRQGFAEGFQSLSPEALI